MSMWGFARNATKSYLSRLNAARAASLVNRAFKMGTGYYGRGMEEGYGIMRSAMLGTEVGARTLAGGMKSWAWSGQSALTRAARIGTAAGIVGLGVAGRAGNRRMEEKYGPMRPFLGPTPEQTKRMLDDRGINYR